MDPAACTAFPRPATVTNDNVMAVFRSGRISADTVQNFPGLAVQITRVLRRN